MKTSLKKQKIYLLSLIIKKKSINYETLNFKRDKKLEFDFRDYKSLKELFKEIYYWKLSIDRAEDLQNEFSDLLTALEKYKPTKPEFMDEKLKLLDNERRFCNGREMMINAFKNEIFPFCHQKFEYGDEGKNDIRDENGPVDYEKFDRLISLIERYINDDLIRKHFQVQNLSTLFKRLF